MRDRDAALQVLQRMGTASNRGQLEQVKLFAKLVEFNDPEVSAAFQEAETCGAFRFLDIEEWLYPKITQRFLRALRGLVKEGLAEAYWRGSGAGMMCRDDGYPTKVRCYKIAKN